MRKASPLLAVMKWHFDSRGVKQKHILTTCTDTYEASGPGNQPGCCELVETTKRTQSRLCSHVCVCACVHRGNILLSEFTIDADNEQLPQ